MTTVLATASSDAVRYGNIWVPVQGYYAAFAATRAYLLASGSSVDTHTGVLRALGHNVLNSRWLGRPWAAACVGCPHIATDEFSCIDACADPDVSNLAIPRDAATAWGLIKMCLKTTRLKALDDSFDDWRKRNKRKQVRASEKQRLADQLGPTTLLDFFYRMRIRSNYRDTDAFAFGAWLDEEARDFYESTLALTSATIRWLEGLIQARIGEAAFGSVFNEFFGTGRRIELNHPARDFWRLGSPR